MGDHLENTGQFDRAVELYRKGLETDILAEEMYCRLIRCHMAAGRTIAAIAAYERCRKVLQSLLGIEPSRETQAAYQALNDLLNTNK